MDYQKIYNNLIEKRSLEKYEGYIEKHHIIPKCLGGSNDPTNIVSLSAKEHFVAHQLLAKIHNTNHKIIYAAFRMSFSNKLNGRIYSWLKILRSQQGHSDETKLKMSNSRKGKICTQETKDKISKQNKGKKRNQAFKDKLSLINKGKTLSEETKLKIGKSQLGKIQAPHSEEAKAKMSKAKKGRKLSEETKAKMSKVRKGRKFSDQHIKNLVESVKNSKRLKKEKSLDVNTKEDQGK